MLLSIVLLILSSGSGHLVQRLILTIFCVCVLRTTLCNTVPTISVRTVTPNDAFDLQKTDRQLIEHICSVYININKTVLFILTKQRFSILTSSPGQEEILCMFLIETNLYLFSCWVTRLLGCWNTGNSLEVAFSWFPPLTSTHLQIQVSPSPHLCYWDFWFSPLRSSTLLSSVAVSFPRRLVVPCAAETEILHTTSHHHNL